MHCQCKLIHVQQKIKVMQNAVSLISKTFHTSKNGIFRMNTTSDNTTPNGKREIIGQETPNEKVKYYLFR